MARGRRGCALKLAVCLHTVGWVILLAGCLTPYWGRVQDSETEEVIAYNGLLMSCKERLDCTMNDLNVYSDLSDKVTLYGMLAVTFGIVAMVTQFFVVQAYCMASCNRSCGEKYSPDGLMIFSLLTGFIVVVCLVMYELQMGRTLAESTNTTQIKMDYSRGLVMLAAGLIFLGSFVTVCDRRPEPGK